MAAPALLESDIEAGRRFLAALDSIGFRVDAAFWFFHQDAGRYQFCVASPEYDRAWEALDRLLAVLQALPPPKPDILSLCFVSPGDDLVTRAAFYWGPFSGPGERRHTDAGSEGDWFDDFVIYRLPPPAHPRAAGGRSGS